MKNYIKTSALILTAALTAVSCQKKDENIPEETKIPLPETTQITEISENDPHEYDFFAIYSDKPQPTEQQSAEIVDSLGKIFDACGFLYGQFPESSKYYNNFADLENTVHEEKVWDYTYHYYPINTDYAADEEELMKNIRSALSEKFIDDEKLYNELFENSDGTEIVPKYQIIDGTLCMLTFSGPIPMPTSYENIKILDCDGKTAEAIIFSEKEREEDYYISLEYSEEYGWRASRIESCDLDEADIFYNLLYVKTDIINMILDGGATPPSPREITVDGKEFAETDITMSISDMKEIFADTFCTGIYNSYSKQYIDDVYYEESGIIYRDKNADKYYIPEIIIDPCDFGQDRTFFDRYSNTTENIHIRLTGGENGNDVIYNDLPIKKQFALIKAETDVPYEENVSVSEIDENAQKMNEMLYNAIYLKTEKLNNILGGIPSPDVETITVNNETYTKNNIVSIKEMENFFNETFALKSFNPPESFSGVTIGDDLRNELIKKYITNVYYEQDGKVYRRNSAPRYYLPEIVFSPDTENKVKEGLRLSTSAINTDNSMFTAETEFRDREGNITSSDVSVYYSMTNYSENEYEFIYIASELPLIEIK